MNRSLLFVPGNVPKMIANCDVYCADGVILDLEDSVPLNEKDSARCLVRHAIRKIRQLSDCEIVVRINPHGTTFCNDDIAEIVPSKPDAILLPKVAGKIDVEKYEEKIRAYEKANGIEEGSIKLMALIECAEAVCKVEEIAKCENIVAMILGSGDLSIDLHVKHSFEEDELLYVRERMVVAARAYGVRCYDTPHMYVHDMDDLDKQTKLARRLGFTGKAAVHPDQVRIINKYFSPTQDEIDKAKAMLDVVKEAEKTGRGATMLGNEMADIAHIKQSREILEFVNNNKLGGWL